MDESDIPSEARQGGRGNLLADFYNQAAEKGVTLGGGMNDEPPLQTFLVGRLTYVLRFEAFHLGSRPQPVRYFVGGPSRGA